MVPAGTGNGAGNRSDKAAGTVVGLHYHLHQADYWHCTRGTARVIFTTPARVRPSHGATQTIEISEDNCRGVLIPPGVAHGFASFDDVTPDVPGRQLLQPR